MRRRRRRRGIFNVMECSFSIPPLPVLREISVVHWILQLLLARHKRRGRDRGGSEDAEGKHQEHAREAQRQREDARQLHVRDVGSLRTSTQPRSEQRFP
jgi:hypothetical protein